MAEIQTTVTADEKTYQTKFYEAIWGGGNLDGNIRIDRSTDGYTDGILFEHKENLVSFGISKALSQALIYLSRFNMDGIPVPGKIILVDQLNKKAYIYKSEDYKEYINNIEAYAGLTASKGIQGFKEKSDKKPRIVDFDISSAAGMANMLQEVSKAPTFVKVDITPHNVYGWSRFYYSHAPKPKAKKQKLFEELRSPKTVLKKYINPWQGEESEFALIMDLLNDPTTQKKLGAFYTPEPYCELAHELLQQAIARVPEGNDYVIIDRCAGTGNMEVPLSDEEMSHVIIGTYELKEWYVMKDRVGDRARYVIPPIPNNGGYPELDSQGFLKGANALDEKYCNDLKRIIEETKQADNVTIIFYENPPYLTKTNIEFQKSGDSKDTLFAGDYATMKLAEARSGRIASEMSNVFIWSAFELFMKDPTDSYVVLAKPKYWRSDHLINKRFMNGFLMNKKHFHADAGCILCALWSNEDDSDTEEIVVMPYDIDEDAQKAKREKQNILVKKIYKLFSDHYYDKRKLETDICEGILAGTHGYEDDKPNRWRISPRNGDDIIGYLVADSFGFENQDSKSSLLSLGRYNGNGFYLREDNFLEKLPMFAASRYVSYNRHWTQKALIMKSADGYKRFFADVKSGDANDFLYKCLIFTCFELQNHMVCFEGSDGREYTNELCFGDKNTLASKTLSQAIANGDYVLTADDQDLIDDWAEIITRVKEQFDDGTYRYPYDQEQRHGYNPKYVYGLYQIAQEINYKIPSGKIDKNGKPEMVFADGDLNRLISDFKKKVASYYLDNVVDGLFEYEFLK